MDYIIIKKLSHTIQSQFFQVLATVRNKAYSYPIYTLQIQFAQLIALTYHNADSSISYSVAITDSQFFQMYASVNTNTLINLPHSHTQTLALHVQDRPLHLDK